MAPGVWEGHTSNYIPVDFASDLPCKNQMVFVELTGFLGEKAEGKRVFEAKEQK